MNLINTKLNKSLFFAPALSHRFRNVKINFYVSEVETKYEKQFAALTFLLDDKTVYIAFRGTDDSIVGWKEDVYIKNLYPIKGYLSSYDVFYYLYK
ncbi:MAG: Mbeg1-like protein [Terrisporobacter sp.]